MFLSLFLLQSRWETFTDAVVKVLSTRKNIVYLLWGNPAQLKYVTPCTILPLLFCSVWFESSLSFEPNASLVNIPML